MRPKNKYRAVRAEFNGEMYDSKAEASYAAQLQLLRSAVYAKEKVIRVERQPSFKLAGGIVYRADFRVTYADGREEVVDVKGPMTAIFKMKMKLMEERYPEITIKLIKK